MAKPQLSFAQNIEAAKSAEVISADVETIDHPSGSRLAVRYQGCFVTELKLASTGQPPVDVLYSSPDLTVSKLTASHIMSPVGPSEGIGGQHGFPRWATYLEFPQHDGVDGEKQTLFQAQRSDNGIGVSKHFSLTNDTLVTETTLVNPGDNPVPTSIGEHLYFALDSEIFDGLEVNGQSLNALLGDGSLEVILQDEPLYWEDFAGNVTIHFPKGHTINLISDVTNASKDASLGMLIWHKPGSPSICFEPTLGFQSMADNEQLVVEPHRDVTLTTTIQIGD